MFVVESSRVAAALSDPSSAALVDGSLPFPATFFPLHVGCTLTDLRILSLTYLLSRGLSSSNDAEAFDLLIETFNELINS